MDSKNITATNARLNAILGGIVDKKIDNRNFEKVIDKKIEDSKIKTGVITKYYPYKDKAEVKLDKTGKTVLCKILHRYGGDMIDFYTPLAFEESFCDKLKEPCVIPKAQNNVCVLEVDDADSKEHLILGYYQNKDIVGIDPAKSGNLKITSISEPNVFWIEFGRNGLDLRLPNRPTEKVGNVEENMKAVTTYTKEEVDELIKNIKTGETADVSDKISYTDLQRIIEDYKQVSSDKYYFFRGDCWTINANYESSASITSTSDKNMKITGTFRTINDMIGLYWYSKDPITHPYISYGEKCDYSNVVLEFDYRMSGCRDFGFEGTYDNAGHCIKAPVSITIVTNHGETYYVTMSRFITHNNGVNHFKLDFENLYAQVGNHYLSSKGEDIEFKEGDNLKIPVNDIKYILLVIVPDNFVENRSQYTVMNNVDFDCEIYNIKVENGDICHEHIPLEPHKIRICEGYDDFYDLNPRRVTREMRKLGYAEWCDLYIGASHFYEKSGTVGELINVNPEDFNHDRTSKMVLNKNVPLNRAFSSWLDCYSRELKKNGTPNLIISVSMENLQCPDDWKQKQAVPRDMNKNPNGYALTGWVPSTFFYSPCNEEVAPYMQSVSEACLDIVVANGMRPILQMGEAWWWWNENYKPTDGNGNPVDVEYWQPPCFYDEATKNKYLSEFGKPLPEYNTSWVKEFDNETVLWLNRQLCEYSDKLREVVKKPKYQNGIYMALFFPPSVLDEDRVPPIMERVNYIRNAYSPLKLDILQLEDYDWVTGLPQSPETKERDRAHHKKVYTIGQDLGFTLDRLHYYGGFVQYPEDATEYWRLINEAMNEALEKQFAEVYVWAGTQVRRDNKMIGYDKYEMVQNLLFP